MAHALFFFVTWMTWIPAPTLPVRAEPSWPLFPRTEDNPPPLDLRYWKLEEPFFHEAFFMQCLWTMLRPMRLSPVPPFPRPVQGRVKRSFHFTSLSNRKNTLDCYPPPRSRSDLNITASLSPFSRSDLSLSPTQAVILINTLSSRGGYFL